MHQQVKTSIGRCLNRGDLIGRFYEIFLNADPVIAEKFRDTDMQQQKQLLEHGIQLALMFADDNSVGKKGLARIRETHSRKNLNISPDLYSVWLESFMQAVEEIDPEYNVELDLEWREVLQKSIDYIVSGYND